jgi:hypothetical protein
MQIVLASLSVYRLVAFQGKSICFLIGLGRMHCLLQSLIYKCLNWQPLWYKLKARQITTSYNGTANKLSDTAHKRDTKIPVALLHKKPAQVQHANKTTHYVHISQVRLVKGINKTPLLNEQIWLIISKLLHSSIFFILQGLQEKGLQSRSMTAHLFIKLKLWMKKWSFYSLS